MAHADNLPRKDGARDALDVASGFTWIGKRSPDIRYSSEIRPKELPWPLRFYFVFAADEPGAPTYPMCVGFELGRPVSRDEAINLDPDDLAVTAARFQLLADNFVLYRQMAERLLLPTEENVQAARKTRLSMSRRRGSQHTVAELAALGEEFRARNGEASRMWEMASAHGVDRSTMYRRLKKAEEHGFLEPGEVKRRKH